jgi:hypothetical protein
MLNDKEHILALFFTVAPSTPGTGCMPSFCMPLLLESYSDTIVLESPPFATLRSNSVFELRDVVNLENNHSVSDNLFDRLPDVLRTHLVQPPLDYY